MPEQNNGNVKVKISAIVQLHPTTISTWFINIMSVWSWFMNWQMKNQMELLDEEADVVERWRTRRCWLMKIHEVDWWMFRWDRLIKNLMELIHEPDWVYRQRRSCWTKNQLELIHQKTNGVAFWWWETRRSWFIYSMKNYCIWRWLINKKTVLTDEKHAQ